MKIKRYTAANTHQALRRVREQQGDDAVILCNRKTSEGIEVVSATEFDEALYQTIADEIRAGAQSESVEPPPVLSEISPSIADSGLSDIRSTLTELHSLVASQLRSAPQGIPGAPNSAITLPGAQLRKLGFDGPAAVQLERALTDAGTEVLTSETLALALQPFVADAVILPPGERRVIAVVGQTGVGKTTTIAKLSVSAALEGNKRVALVSADSERIGAHQQLSRLSQLLDIPLFEARDNVELKHTLEATEQYDHVLIDTAGRAPGDVGIESQLTTLRNLGEPVALMLTLAANVQASALARSLACYERFAPDYIALTKLDETEDGAIALGQIANAAIPLALLSAGQKIPDDLHIAASSLPWLATRLIHDSLDDEHNSTHSRSQGARHVTA